MSTYPLILDTILTLPTVAGSGEEPTAINALQESILAIEKELGVHPARPYEDVRTRLDIIESRVNNPFSGTVPDGYIYSPLYIINSLYPFTISISTGRGYPTEDRIDGSLYIRQDGSIAEGLYARRSGAWSQILTEPFVAAGDLTGDHKTQTVGQRKSFLFMGA